PNTECQPYNGGGSDGHLIDVGIIDYHRNWIKPQITDNNDGSYLVTFQSLTPSTDIRWIDRMNHSIANIQNKEKGIESEQAMTADRPLLAAMTQGEHIKGSPFPISSLTLLKIVAR